MEQKTEINKEAPKFVLEGFHDEKIKKINLDSYKGNWVVLFFYPGDFTFICPTELGELADNYEKFKSMNAEVLSISTDSVHVHKAWHDHSPTIKKINFPMLSDQTGSICKDYGVFREDGVALRGTFIIDPDGVLKTIEIHENSIGRSVSELLRKLEAAIFVREHGGEICPASWSPGKTTLKPGLNLVGKI